MAGLTGWRGAGVLFALAACVPFAFVLALGLAPFWDWFETHTGIESLGHSGPAGWCFWLVLGLSWLLVLAVGWRRR